MVQQPAEKNPDGILPNDRLYWQLDRYNDHKIHEKPTPNETAITPTQQSAAPLDSKIDHMQKKSPLTKPAKRHKHHTQVTTFHYAFRIRSKMTITFYFYSILFHHYLV